MKQQRVSVAWADRLLVAINASHLWHLEPELGGFSDVYFHPAIVGSPSERDAEKRKAEHSRVLQEAVDLGILAARVTRGSGAKITVPLEVLRGFRIVRKRPGIGDRLKHPRLAALLWCTEIPEQERPSFGHRDAVHAPTLGDLVGACGWHPHK